MPRITFTQAYQKTVERIGDLPPLIDVRERVLREVVAAAGVEQRRLVRKMTVHRYPSHSGALGDLADRRPGSADRLVELDRGVDDPLPGLVLALGATLQLVLAGHDQDDT